MPTKRRTAKGQLHRITREAISAYQSGDVVALHRALGLRPWQPSPLEADTPEPPSDWQSGPWADAWPLAFDLRGKLELEAATPTAQREGYSRSCKDEA